MSGMPGLADRLKEATAEAHRDAERRLFQRDLVKGRISPTQLFAFQAQMRHLIGAIHDALDGGGWIHAGFRAAMAGHLERLDADLKRLGNGDALPPPSPVLDGFLRGASHAEALGAFYVIEGSMNGNRFIRRAVAEQQPDIADALRYFDPYGEAQRANWKACRQRISEAGATLPDVDAALASASRTFEIVGLLSEEAARSRTAA